MSGSQGKQIATIVLALILGYLGWEQFSPAPSAAGGNVESAFAERQSGVQVFGEGGGRQGASRRR